MNLKRLVFISLLLVTCVNGWADSWKGKWIVSHFDQFQSNSWYAYRKDFDVNQLPKEAITRIAVDSKYWLWVNEELVVFEGGLKRGPSPRDTYYDEVDIAPYLKKGKNTFAIMTNYFGKDGFSHISSGKAGLLVDCTAQDINLFTDNTWKGCRLQAFGACEAPLPNSRLSETSICYDGNKDFREWIKQDFDNSRMGEVSVWGEAGCYPWNKLVKRPIPLWKNYGLKEYVKQEVKGDTIICSLPYNCQFTTYLKVNAPKNLKVEVYTDNYLYYNGSDVGLRSEYTTREGVQDYENPVWVNGHKVYYVIPKECKVESLQFRETGYNTEFEGSFACSNPFYNKLWQKSLRTLYITMRDNFMDCPDRERAQWTGDAVNESLEAYYALSVSSHSLVKKWLYEIINWQRADGSLYAPAPAGNWFKELPGQVLATIGRFGVWNYYLYTGDKAAIRDLYPSIKKYMKLWEPYGKGTMKMRMGDWTWGDWGEHRDMVLIYNLWYCIAAQGMELMANELGYESDANEWRQFLDTFKTSFNNQFWNGACYRHPDYKDLTDDRVQALAVVSGIASPAIYKKLLKVFQQEEHASPYMEKYVFEAMMQMGYGVEAMKRHEKRFSTMVNDPYFTTLFEGWGIGSEGYGGGTVNHAWSGGGLAVCSQYVAGVAPLEPGFKTYHVLPLLPSLDNTEALVPTVKGNIKVKCVKEARLFSLATNVLEGTNAWIGIPKDKYKEIRINGESVWKKGQFISSPLVSKSKVTDQHFAFYCLPGNYKVEGLK